MKFLPLSRNLLAIIDNEDYAYLSRWKWYCNAYGYAERTAYVNGKRRNVRLHSLLLPPKSGFVVDHVNQNRLDNRRMNLRYATKRQNAINSKLRCTNTSGVTGVAKSHKKWEAYGTIDRHYYHLGRFADFNEAVNCRKRWEVAHG